MSTLAPQILQKSGVCATIFRNSKWSTMAPTKDKGVHTAQSNGSVEDNHPSSKAPKNGRKIPAPPPDRKQMEFPLGCRICTKSTTSVPVWWSSLLLDNSASSADDKSQMDCCGHPDNRIIRSYFWFTLMMDNLLYALLHSHLLFHDSRVTSI